MKLLPIKPAPPVTSSFIPLLLLMRWVKPVPGLADTEVLLIAVYLGWDNGGIVPGDTHFVRVFVVIEAGDEIDRERWLGANRLGAMEIVARYSHQHRLVGAGDYLGELVCGLVIGADFHGAFYHQEIVHLTSEVFVPGPYDARATVAEVYLDDPFVDEVFPVLAQCFGEEAALIRDDVQVVCPYTF